MTATDRPDIRAFVERNRERETALLAALVRTPSDNPPGDLRGGTPSGRPGCWRGWASRSSGIRCRPSWCGRRACARSPT